MSSTEALSCFVSIQCAMSYAGDRGRGRESANFNFNMFGRLCHFRLGDATLYAWGLVTIIPSRSDTVG